MVEEGPYEILPYAEIDKLKKQIEDLRKKTASSHEILDAVNRLAKIMESMLHLFESAAAGMKKEGEGPLGKKLDKLIDQHETIAESILVLRDRIKELQSEEKEPREEKLQPIMPPEPIPGFGPDFSMPKPRFKMPAQMPRMPQPRTQPSRQTPPPVATRPSKEGPIPMPTGSFKDLSFGKRKKGLFRK